jgi:hypothetical protein
MKLQLLLVTVLVGPLAAQSPGPLAQAAGTITAADVMHRVSIVANDSMLGRDTPSRGLELTAQYVASEFRRAGLRPAGDGDDYIQRFGLTRWAIDTAVSAVEMVAARARGVARLGSDARYLDGPIPAAPLRGAVVLVAGAAQPTEIKNRIVLLVADFSKPVPAALNQQMLDLAAAGPQAVLILSNRDSAAFSDRLRLAARPRFTRDSAGNTGVGAPIIEVHQRTLGPVLAAAGIDPVALRRLGRGAQRTVAGLTIEIRLARRILARASVPNVAGVLEGRDSVLRNEYLVYSAHTDHIGISPGQPDSINNGADDNASGVAGLLELAEAFAQPNARPRRSILFLAPGAEEPGLLGSAYYTEHPTVPIASMVADINMDLIGRNWPDSVIAVGLEQSDLEGTLQQVVRTHPELRMTPIADRWPEERIFYRSDHYNFARKGVPILFFTSGTHPDYHGPGDEADRIDPEKESRLVRLLFYLGTAIGDRTARPQWNPESYRQIVDR